MKRRSLLFVFILTFITLGIYNIYWLAETRKELMARTGTKIPSVVLLFLPVIFLVISMFGIFFLLLFNSNTRNPILAILCFLAGIVSFVIFPWWIFKYGEAVKVATSGLTTPGFTLGMWLLLHITGLGVVWYLIMQDKFNALSNALTTQSLPINTATGLPNVPPSSTWQNVQQPPIQAPTSTAPPTAQNEPTPIDQQHQQQPPTPGVQ